MYSRNYSQFNASTDSSNYDGQNEYGYYDEAGQYFEYDNQDDVISQPIPIIDEHGRVLDPNKINGMEDDNESEDLKTFVSKWQNPRLASLRDAQYASHCVWPEQAEIMELQRFDLYETYFPSLSQIGTCLREESYRLRKDRSYTFKLSMFLPNRGNGNTIKELQVETAGAPLRCRFRPADKKNNRDVSSWVLRESLFCYTAGLGIQGTRDYFVDWEDAPDRYCLNHSPEPAGGWRRLFRFCAYPVTQYYILCRRVVHDVLVSEGGEGYTYLIESGDLVYSKKHWRLVASFYAFDIQMPSSNKYTVYESHVPFPRMNIAMGAISHPEDWTEKFSFYAFDVPLAGTAPFQLQHCIRSIHTTAEGVNRHRLTTEDPILPWQFRMTIFLFPAALEDCSIAV